VVVAFFAGVARFRAGALAGALAATGTARCERESTPPLERVAAWRVTKSLQNRHAAPAVLRLQQHQFCATLESGRDLGKLGRRAAANVQAGGIHHQAHRHVGTTPQGAGAHGRQRERRAGVDLATARNVFVAQHVLQAVVRHQRLAQLQRALDLHFGEVVPWPQAATVPVLGHHHFVVGIGLAEPGDAALALAVQQAGVVHLDADGVVVQAVDAVPLAHAGMPGHRIEGSELHDAPVAPEHDVRRGVALGLPGAERFHRTLQRASCRVVQDHKLWAHGAAHVGCGSKAHVGAGEAVILDAEHVKPSLGLPMQTRRQAGRRRVRR